MDYLVSHLIILGGLLVVSMFFSAVETCLLTLPRSFVEKRAKEPGLQSLAYRDWLSHPNHILTSILIGNNAINIAATTLVAYTSVTLAEEHGWSRTATGAVSSVSVTFILIVFGEVIPKVMARNYSEKAAIWLVPPIYLFDHLLSPVSWVLARMVNQIFPRMEGSVSLVTEEDVKHLIEMGQRSGTIHEEEKRMIHSIFKFTDTKAGEVMVPRTEMFCVELGTDLESLVDTVIQMGYSRVPVYKKSLDNIVGIIQTKDLLSIWKHKELIVLHDLLHKPYFVPETMRVDRLLREFKRGKMHMAIVVDEYGGTSGLVTMEDLLEEIVGEIRDEYDQDEEKEIQRQEDGSWTVEAGVALDDVNKAMGTHFSPRGNVTSLGGYLTEKCGGVPKKGRVIEDREAVFTVTEATDRKVSKVQVVKREDPLPEEAAPASPPRPKRKKAKAPVPEVEILPTETKQPPGNG